METNLLDPAAVRNAVNKVFARLQARKQDAALLVPDAVIRVFVLHFDVFPRSASEALPLLRWRLKKSVPFEAEETLISFMRQAPREEGVDIVTGLARLRIVREYEQLLEAEGMAPGVVMSSTLAALPLLDDRHACPAGSRFREDADDGHRSRGHSVRLPLPGAACAAGRRHAADAARRDLSARRLL